jgi:Xaa-Pro aminopeptidase
VNLYDFLYSWIKPRSKDKAMTTQFTQRWNRCRALFQEQQLSAFWIQDPLNLAYMTGLNLSSGVFILTLSEAYLLVDPRYYTAAQQSAPCKVLPWKDENIFSIWQELTQGQSHSIGVDSTTITHKEYLSLQELISTFITQQEHQDFLLLLPCTQYLARLRSIKDAQEWSMMHRAAQAGWQGYQYILSQLRNGITEAQVSTLLKIFFLQEYGSVPSFEPIIAFGENSALPHHRSSERPLKPNELVLIDIGISLQGYCSDLTRTVAWGHPPEELISYYHAVAHAQQEALDHCRPGIAGAELDALVRKNLERSNLNEAFIHSLGHGVGTEIHEYPFLSPKTNDGKRPLEEGMVITIEPGVYFPGKGGIRIEDMVLVTETGCFNPTPDDKLPLRILNPQ